MAKTKSSIQEKSINTIRLLAARWNSELQILGIQVMPMGCCSNCLFVIFKNHETQSV